MRNRLRRSISRQPARCHDLPGPQHPAHPYLGSHRTADREPRLSPSSARLSVLGQAILRYTGCVLHSIIQCSPAQCSHKGRLPRLAGPVSGASIPLPTSCCRCSRSKLPLSGGAPRMEGAHRRQPALVRPARLASLAFPQPWMCLRQPSHPHTMVGLAPTLSLHTTSWHIPSLLPSLCEPASPSPTENG